MEDFEIPPPNPMQQLCEIIELARQCYDSRKAWVGVSTLGVNQSIRVSFSTKIRVEEYDTDHLIIVDDHAKDCEYIYIARDDQSAMQEMIDRLKEVLA